MSKALTEVLSQEIQSWTEGTLANVDRNTAMIALNQVVIRATKAQLLTIREKRELQAQISAAR